MRYYTIRMMMLLGLAAIFSLGACTKEDPLPEDDQQDQSEGTGGASGTGSTEITVNDKLHGKWNKDSIEYYISASEGPSSKKVTYPQNEFIDINKTNDIITFYSKEDTVASQFIIENKDQLIIDEGKKAGIYKILEISSRRLIFWYHSNPDEDGSESSRPITYYLSK